MVDAVAPQPQLDYHLILSPATGAPSTADVEGIVVEEFVRGDDWATVGLSSAGWTAGEGGWWSSASFSRRMRVEPELAGRVTPTSRYVAETVYRQRGAGQLPAEAVLRTYFRDHQPFATAPPLRLGPTDPPDGFHEKRVYRVLFAKDLRADQLAALTGCVPIQADAHSSAELSTLPAAGRGRWALPLRGVVWRSADGVGEPAGEVADVCDQFGWSVDLEAEAEQCDVDGEFVEGVGSGVQ